ncbi:MAG: neutral zinc metallopeptidase [Polyangiales bacterium]
MKWIPGYRSDDVEDRRGQGGGGFSSGGVGMLFTLFKLFGLPGVLIGGAIMFFGSGLLSSGGSESRAVPREGAQAAQPGDGSDFVAYVFDDVQKTWQGVFSEHNERYQGAKLILFSDATRTGCGTGQAVMGPFYCPLDTRVYIDLSFYQELKQRFGAPGDFAQAYVIAHEVGHHVQHLLGYDEKVQRAAKAQQTGADALSVRLELQADCFAGLWAKASARRDQLDPGDIDEALTAAQAIGDDKLQKQGQGRVTPETWTHGSSAQRARWFKRGYELGTIDGCDTFTASKL